MKYLFDTDILSRLMRSTARARLHQRVARVPVASQCTTSITLGELSFGAHRAGKPELFSRAELLLSSIEILPFDVAAAEQYGPLRARLEGRGARMAEADLRIAAIALVHDCTLVTGNVRHFARVDGLRVENWLD